MENMKSSFAKTNKRHLWVDLNMPPCDSSVKRKFYWVNILVIVSFCQKNIFTLKS